MISQTSSVKNQTGISIAVFIWSPTCLWCRIVDISDGTAKPIQADI